MKMENADHDEKRPTAQGAAGRCGLRLTVT
jgi:hypothetical protein